LINDLRSAYVLKPFLPFMDQLWPRTSVETFFGRTWVFSREGETEPWEDSQRSCISLDPLRPFLKGAEEFFYANCAAALRPIFWMKPGTRSCRFVAPFRLTARDQDSGAQRGLFWSFVCHPDDFRSSSTASHPLSGSRIPGCGSLRLLAFHRLLGPFQNSQLPVRIPCRERSIFFWPHAPIRLLGPRFPARNPLLKPGLLQAFPVPH